MGIFRIWTKTQIGDKLVENEVEISEEEKLSQEEKLELISYVLERTVTTK